VDVFALTCTARLELFRITIPKKQKVMSMRLEEWIGLSPESRRKLVVRWIENDEGEKYQGMANKAADALKTELFGIGDITNVQLGGGDVIYVHPDFPGIEERELVLEVCTALRGCPRLDQVPSTFAGFSVRQVHLGDKREAFLNTWKRLFKELKGWDEATTLKWTEQFENKLTGRQESVLYHYGPLKKAMPTLFAEIRRKPGCMQDVYNEFLEVLWNLEIPDRPDSDHPNGELITIGILFGDVTERFWRDISEREKVNV
jgi:hypothetical protein